MRVFVSCCLLLVLTADCYGDLIMSFTANGSAQPLTTVNVGQTATLDVYLLQTAGEFDAGGTYENDGLINGGVQLNFGSEVQVTAFAEDTAWEFSSLDLSTPGSADLQTGITFFNPPVFPVSDAIRIGTVTFQGAAAGLATVTFADSGALVDLFVLESGTVIDNNVDFASNDAQIQVNGQAIPEPGSIGLSLLAIGAACVVGSFRARRRRQKVTDDDVSPVTESL